MKKSPYPLIASVCAAGFLSGFAGKRIGSGSPHPAAPAAAKISAPGKATTPEEISSSPENASKPPAAKTSGLHSTDTLETLATLKGDALYGRLALWMLDAGEQDIASYWASVKDQKGRKNDITDLVFINWSRLDPQAAIAAVAGTDNEHYAWWAWACHDPKSALAAAIAANPDRVNNVAWGIGEFHGEWLMAHFDQIPESARDNAISGLTKWDDCPDPLAIMEFLKKNGNTFRQSIFNALVRKDPWAAYDWIQSNPATISSQYGSRNSAMDALVKSMGETRPDDLQRLADQTPSGEAKRNMEAVLFENLLKTDPDAALEQAKKTTAPRIAAERLAAIGNSLLKTDPEKAFEMAGNLFTVYPDAMNAISWIRYPNGGSGWGDEVKGVDELVTPLLTKDPARLMATQTPSSQGFTCLTSKWAAQDLVSYTNWVNQQTDPATREPAARAVISQLMQDQNFDEAADWVMSSQKTKEDQIARLISNWARADSEKAREWLENSDIPDDRKSQLLESVGVNKSADANNLGK
ncbi:MAG: hypothetical protein ABIT37_07200 [Luteolibacter sp.]